MVLRQRNSIFRVTFNCWLNNFHRKTILLTARKAMLFKNIWLRSLVSISRERFGVLLQPLKQQTVSRSGESGKSENSGESYL